MIEHRIKLLGKTYLECVNSKSNKFYYLFEFVDVSGIPIDTTKHTGSDGTFHACVAVYGRINTKGKTEIVGLLSDGITEVIRSKIKKGYVLVTQKQTDYQRIVNTLSEWFSFVYNINSSNSEHTFQVPIDGIKYVPSYIFKWNNQGNSIKVMT
jgi:predicted DNA-binding WGR domain protein